MLKNMRRGIPNLFKEGTKHRVGLHEAVLRNLEATHALQDVTKTSLGPSGMNKMIVNHLGKLFVTSDTATILKEMEIAHPAAKLIVMASAMQESEIGDGSNFVICFASELLNKAEGLIEMGLHPSEIVSGYLKAGKKALEFFEESVVEKLEGKALFDKESVIKALLAPIASKQYGYEEFLAPLVADAALTAMPKNPFNFNVDNVRVVKILGGSLYSSEVLRGMIIPQDSIGTVKKVDEAKVAVFTCSIKLADTETKGTVLINNAEELMSYNLSEERELERAIKSIAALGVKVIVTGESLDDLSEHFLEKYGILTVKVSSKFELRRLCKATRSRPLAQLFPITAEDLGYCSKVYVREIGLTKVTVFEQDEKDESQVSTILLRASTHNILNDLERAIDDGVNTIRALTRDGRLTPGAGAVEMEVARKMQQFAAKAPGLEQYALKAFATALEVVPRVLCDNSGLNAIDIISSLYAAHEKGQAAAGIDIDNGTIFDAIKDGKIYDLLILKLQAVKLAVDAATTVLRVDQIIQAKPAGGPKPRDNNPHWDDD